MEKLRSRLGTLFLRFLENPLYNPRAEDFVGIVKNPHGVLREEDGDDVGDEEDEDNEAEGGDQGEGQEELYD